MFVFHAEKKKNVKNKIKMPNLIGMANQKSF